MGPKKRVQKSEETVQAKNGKPVTSSKVSKDHSKQKCSKMYSVFGFEKSDLTSWSNFVKLMCRPMDPASLGFTRFMFGLLMALDIFQERGLSNADLKWGNVDECRFPLFNFLKPLSLAWMYVVYLVMVTGAVGLMLGLFYRLSCLLFVVPYWYIFLLDKTSWNNHSYLYGLVGLMFLFSDGNRFWSLDGLLRPKIRNADVPLWTYCLLRAQFFLLYFIAGLKKLDPDWSFGYSMQKLSTHWVFTPFKFLLTNDQIDLWIVHEGGLIIDLFIGYVLFFDVTRPIGFLFGSAFHLMNSQIFSIGMFPFTMLATMPLFCYVDWPKKLIKKLPSVLQKTMPLSEPSQYSSHCIYPKEVVKPEKNGDNLSKEKKRRSRVPPSDKMKLYHKATTIGLVMYLMSQCFLPYSHFLTKGYNNWTNGLYGYSWDMMVHSWTTQHMRITYVDKSTGDVGYLDPERYSKGERWSIQADMLKQYGGCVSDLLQTKYHLGEVALYVDIWRSLNERFHQRMFDPRVDIVQAEWHPFKPSPWLLPLLTDLSDWRGKLSEIERGLYGNSQDTNVVFIADFPGLKLENYIQEDLGNTSLHVLKGKVIVEMVERNKNRTVKEGDKIQLPPGEYHNVHTVSDTPSCYMYIFVNTTERRLTEKITAYEQKMAEKGNKTTKDSQSPADGDDVDNDEDPDFDDDQAALLYKEVQGRKQKLEEHTNRTFLQRIKQFAKKKYNTFARGAIMTRVALQSLLTGRTFHSVFNSTVGASIVFYQDNE